MPMPDTTGPPVITAVPLPHGVALQVAAQGDPAGVPVLLLHGYADSWRSFAGVLPHLPASLRAVIPTLRGHGDSERPADGYRIRDFAADVAALMEVLELPPAVIVGHSIGSAVAQRLAVDHPRRTRGLVLVGSFVSWRDNPLLSAFWDEALAHLADPLDPAFVRDFQASPRVPGDFIDRMVQESLKVPARVWRAAWRAMLEEDDLPDLARVTAPTRIFWGDQDALFPRRDQEALAAAIPGAQLIVYEGAGHALHWEQPARFAADLTAFVKETLGESHGRADGERYTARHTAVNGPR
jgi:pimeloyl-ACP methyl ester carboxylesterase